MTSHERVGRPPPPLHLCVAWLAAAAFVGAASAGEVAGFYSESTSTLVSKRVDIMTRKHRTWLTEDRLRFDDGDVLTTIVRFDTGDIFIANRKKQAYIRQTVKNLGPALIEMGDSMVRHVGTRVTRTRFTKSIGGTECTQCRIDFARATCSVWVENDSREVFNAARAMARDATRKLGGLRSGLVLALGGLGGVPREIQIGDPKRLQLTWTVDRFEQKPIPDRVFDIPVGCTENPSLPAAAFTLPEHVYFVGEATAAWFAPTKALRHRSLLPPGMAITSESTLKDFYRGRQGSERYGILRWGKPMCFYLAPELWRYPLSGRAVSLVLVIGTCFRGGGLQYYPNLQQLKRPAN